MTFHSVRKVIIPTDFHSYFTEGWLNHQPGKLSFSRIFTVFPFGKGEDQIARRWLQAHRLAEVFSCFFQILHPTPR